MRYVILATIVFGLSGCLMEVVTTTAIEAELAAEGAKSATSTLEMAEDTSRVMELQNAVRSYSGLNGRNPATLDDLVPSVIQTVPLQKDGRPFRYDPVTGNVSISRGDAPPAPQPVPAVTQQDLQNLEQISGAIYKYWEATGAYPPNLQSLAPNYMSSIPVMANGDSYVYNVRTGAVNHPRELIGANPAGLPAQGGNSVDAISAGHTNRQVQVMDDLGL